MKRYCVLAVLMLIGSQAHAGSFSFSVGGHRVQVASPRHCLSPSCTSITISGLPGSRRKRAVLEDTGRDASPAPVATIVPAAPPVVAAPAPAPVVTPPVAAKPVIATPQPPSAPPPAEPAVTTPSPAPAVQPVVAPPAPPPPAPVEPPVKVQAPAPVSPSQPVAKASHEVEEDPDSPVGDWQTQGKGLVRIARCGPALCGYAVDPVTNEKGEAMLVNMKPKTDTRWSGRVFSQGSGDTYYGTMEMKKANTLRVEACALLRFYCTGSDWTRAGAGGERLITSRQSSPQPRS